MRTAPHIILFGLLSALPLVTFGQLLPNLGGQRAGISTLTFLKNDMSARSMAMSGANLCLSADGMAVAHNPALMAQVTETRIAVSDLAIGVDVHQAWGNATIPLKSSNSGLGLSMNYLSAGAMKVRTEFQPQGNGTYFHANQFALGLGYAKKLSDRFSFGLQLKYVNERLDQYRNHTVAADLGFLYSTDVKDLKFGIVVQNFGGNSSLAGDFLAESFNRTTPTTSKYNVPTVFRLGASMKPWEKDRQSLLVAVQLEHPNDNGENVRLGLEYQYHEVLCLRAGYKLNVLGERMPTMGVGYKWSLGRYYMWMNYALNVTQYLGPLHSFGLDLALQNDAR